MRNRLTHNHNSFEAWIDDEPVDLIDTFDHEQIVECQRKTGRLEGVVFGVIVTAIIACVVAEFWR